MIIWLNGTFGTGKTTTAKELATILDESYWKELQQGFNQHSLEVFHVVLNVDSVVLARRINADELEQKARQWRLDHIRDYAAARAWMVASADLVVDSTSLSVAEVAGSILQAIQTSDT